MLFFFFNDPSTTEIYTLSLHDALPISAHARESVGTLSNPENSAAVTASTCSHKVTPRRSRMPIASGCKDHPAERDRKSTRLNSSHQIISYAVFCLKKKKKNNSKIQKL